MDKKSQKIAVLGSTGSIGTQTLDVIADHPGLFRAEVLTAGRNWELLARQALRFRPRLVVIDSEEGYVPLREALRGTGIEVRQGAGAIADAAALPSIDTVVTALVGYSGLLPTLAAADAGKTIALANKETLVCAGEIVTARIRRGGATLLPVDSEHSAIFQCLQGENRDRLRRIILTASGGPFRTFTARQLEDVSVEQALRNPNWDMGAKVTIDSASMMNKGFEMIEARWLFSCAPRDIDIVVHPQSVIHSAVEYCDGSVIAQLAVPDMHLPIRYTLGYPDRLEAPRQERLDLTRLSTLTFEAPDRGRFPLLQLAFRAIEAGGNAPCALNAANEIAVAAFLRGQTRFTSMPRIAEETLHAIPLIENPSLADIIETNAEARRIAEQCLADNYQL